jgi:citrate synthase
MASLKEILRRQVPHLRDEAGRIVAEHGDRVISEVTIAQAYGGLRGVKALVCDTSEVDPHKGVIYRGIPVAELTDRCPEEIFFLLCTGKLPTAGHLKQLREELAARAVVPKYVFDVLRRLPTDSHPMAMLSIGLMALEEGSKFRTRYNEGLGKDEYWEAIYEDALDLLAKLPAIAAAVYRIRHEMGDLIAPDPKLDWSDNLCHMMGVNDQYGRMRDLMRLYLVLHADHEGGNVSAYVCHAAGSALSDPYYAVPAGLNGLAGPLHGLANQECLRFHVDIRDEFGGVPTADQIREHAWKLLRANRVIPGFGHAVLRDLDPRYVALRNFALQACPDAEMFRIAELAYQVIPGVLTEHGKAKNVQPNVDAISGVLLYCFGVTQPRFYTALFGTSRCLGMLAQLILNRIIGTPLTRPKSITTVWIKEHLGSK